MVEFDVHDNLIDVQEAAELLLEQTSNETKSFIPAILISGALLALAKEVKLTRDREYSKGDEISSTAEALMRISEAVEKLIKK